MINTDNLSTSATAAAADTSDLDRLIEEHKHATLMYGAQTEDTPEQIKWSRMCTDIEGYIAGYRCENMDEMEHKATIIFRIVLADGDVSGWFGQHGFANIQSMIHVEAIPNLFPYPQHGKRQ